MDEDVSFSHTQKGSAYPFTPLDVVCPHLILIHRSSGYHASSLCQDGIFGPVVSVIRADDEAHAIVLANASRYGPAGTVSTRSLETGMRVARQVEAGSFGINCYEPDMGAPWGGVKNSGTGREQGPQSIECFIRIDTAYAF
jgi:aldehyde dehydrogenase (NAD+)